MRSSPGQPVTLWHWATGTGNWGRRLGHTGDGRGKQGLRCREQRTVIVHMADEGFETKYYLVFEGKEAQAACEMWQLKQLKQS